MTDKIYIKEYKREYYLKNKEKILNLSKEYYKNNREHIIKRVNLWVNKNIEKVRIYKKNYITKNSKRIYKNYFEKYPEKIRARDYANYNSQRGTYCERCNSIEQLEFHHIDYERRKGITLCNKCHRLIHKQTPPVIQSYFIEQNQK